MPKKDRNAGILAAGWLTALTLISLVLLRTAEPGSFSYWARVGAVAVGWCIFLLSFTPLRSMRDLRVVSSRADSAILLLVLVSFFVIAAGAFVNALVHGHMGTALLFGLAGLGVFNVVRDLAARMAGRKGRI